MKNDHEPVAQALNSILLVLDMIAAAARTEEDYDEIAAEKFAVAQVRSRANLILKFIDAGPLPEVEIAPLRLVQ